MNDYERGKFYMEMQLAPERINLRNEILKLKNNWDELKSWIKENGRYFDSYTLDYVLDKMKELEEK